MNKPYGIVIHGGAGAIRRGGMPPGLEADYRTRLSEALDAGHVVLEHGGSSVDAVIAAIKIMEDSPLFNAGKGAVMNAEGECELDAAIMDGKTLGAGSVAGLKHIKNPITLARAVMDKTPHVMLIGDGAEQFARQIGFELVPNEYFQTERRRQQLDHAKELEKSQLLTSGGWGRPAFVTIDENADRKLGTVGAVALDQEGNLAAGTSTGGLTNKKYGRVGDSPIIGAGTYANNATGAISCTGHGEYFMRICAAHDISDSMEYKDLSLSAAADHVMDKVAKLGGDGGLIALDRHGNVTMPFNTPGMYRGWHVSGKPAVVQIYKDDK